MSEQNKAIVRRISEEVWNQGKLNVADELYASDYVDHNAPPGSPGGLAGFKGTVTMLRASFPDLVLTLDQTLAEGDRVAIRQTIRGTHKGPFMGVAATGKQVSFGGMVFVRIENGKVVERWGIIDVPGLMGQLTGGGGGH
jgi:steroid delta-isomerase-like uncharacterized protein